MTPQNDATNENAKVRARGSKSIAFRLLMVGILPCMPLGCCPGLHAKEPAEVKNLPRIGAGTRVDNPNARRWNRVILLAKPRIATGDVDQLSQSIRDASTAFTLTILATVQPYSALDGSQRFRLSEVGVGCSAPIKGVQTVVSYATVQQQGADPGFIGRQVLNANEEHLSKAVMVARSSTSLVFDTPGIMHRRGAHHDYIVRHLIWIDPKDGRTSTAVWLLEKSANGQLRTAKEPLKLLAAGTKEDRQIHVNGDEFFLGIPSETAFAVEDLPPGTPIPWNDRLAEIAALNGDSVDLSALTAALDEAIAITRGGESAAKP